MGNGDSVALLSGLAVHVKSAYPRRNTCRSKVIPVKTEATVVRTCSGVQVCGVLSTGSLSLRRRRCPSCFWRAIAGRFVRAALTSEQPVSEARLPARPQNSPPLFAMKRATSASAIRHLPNSFPAWEAFSSTQPHVSMTAKACFSMEAL